MTAAGAADDVFVSNRQRTIKLRAAEIRAAARAAAAYAGGPRGPLSVVIVGDRKMRELNRAYAGVSGTTDCLAFDFGGGPSPGGEGLAGEVIVNAAEAVAQAARRRHAALDELLLYVVHGVLHLAGYSDHAGAPRRRMRAAETSVMRKLARGRAGGK